MPSQKQYPSLPSKLILISTKAYFSPNHTVKYLTSILDPSNNILPLLEKHSSEIRFVLIPDFLTIYPCSQILNSRFPATSSHHSTPDPSEDGDRDVDPSKWPISLGAQNAYPSATYGAYTGEIIPQALKSLSCTVIELSHAERRRYLGENDDTAAEKSRAVCEAGMIPLVCIGEVERPDLRGPMSQAVGKAMAQLKPQILRVLGAVSEDAPVIFAYEPVWAIGAAEPAGVDYVGPVVGAIREVAKSAVGLGKGRRSGEVKIVYGGSAGPGLWSGKSNGGNGLGQYVDGLFLGRFAHEIGGVRDVVEEVVQSLGKS